MGSPPWLRPLCEHVAVSAAPVRKSLAAGVDRRVGSRQNLLLDMCVTSGRMGNPQREMASARALGAGELQ